MTTKLDLILSFGKLLPEKQEIPDKPDEVPEGLDLDSWINAPPSPETSDDDYSSDGGKEMFTRHLSEMNHESKKREPTEEEIARMREARKAEQENNMYYLKGSTKPVAEVKTIELSVPLKINNLVNSDQFMDKKKKEKKTKKKKKSKKKAESSSEDDEPPVQVEVNTNIGEMPEGAELSDNDQDNGLSESDPHRALDIDLDVPLREEERLPVRSHRPLPEPLPEKPKKKKEKEKKPKKEKEKDKKEAVPDLWLDAGKAEYESVPEKSKKKKKKKEKEEKKPKRSKRKEEDKQGGLLVQETEPEPEINGQEQLLVAVEPTATATVLAKNNKLSLTYELQIHNESSQQIMSRISLENIGDSLIKDLRLNLSESAIMVLVREPHVGDGDLDLAFQLSPGQARDVMLLFRAQDCVAPLKLRGTLTYSLLDSEGRSTPDKLDLWLRFPLVSLISDRSPSQEEFSSLLASGELSHKQIISLSIPFSQALPQLISRCKLKLIEQIGDTASLYVRSLGTPTACLLLKTDGSGVKLEGKSDSPALLNSLFDHVRSELS